MELKGIIIIIIKEMKSSDSHLRCMLFTYIINRCFNVKYIPPIKFITVRVAIINDGIACKQTKRSQMCIH